MEGPRDLLVSTFGGDIGEIVPGIRYLSHRHLVLVTDTALGKKDASIHFLKRLGIQYEVLLVDPLDLAGATLLIERKVQEHLDLGWRARIDITGGRKLLSDAATLAAISTGAELCCFEMGVRRFPLLAAMGVREALPKDLAEVLFSRPWPISLEEASGKGESDPLQNKLRRMKQMDLVRVVRDRDMPMVCLTERGKACLDWIMRAKQLSES